MWTPTLVLIATTTLVACVLLGGGLYETGHNPVEGGTPAKLLMNAVLLYNGDWRIDRIHWTGSDASLKPWGLTTGKVKHHEAETPEGNADQID